MDWGTLLFNGCNEPKSWKSLLLNESLGITPATATTTSEMPWQKLFSWHFQPKLKLKAGFLFSFFFPVPSSISSPTLPRSNWQAGSLRGWSESSLNSNSQRLSKQNLWMFVPVQVAEAPGSSPTVRSVSCPLALSFPLPGGWGCCGEKAKLTGLESPLSASGPVPPPGRALRWWRAQG